MGKKFNKFLRNAAKQGIYVGDINQATTAFQGGGYPTAPSQQAPTPPPAPAPIKPPTQQNATIASAGAGVGSGKSRKRMRSGALRIARRKSATNTGTTRGRLNY